MKLDNSDNSKKQIIESDNKNLSKNENENDNFLGKYKDGLVNSYSSLKHRNSNENSQMNKKMSSIEEKNNWFRNENAQHENLNNIQHGLNSMPFGIHIPADPFPLNSSMMNNVSNPEYMNFISSFLVSSYTHFFINYYYQSYMERNKFYAKELGFVPYTLRYTNQAHQIRKKFLVSNRENYEETWFNLYHKVIKLKNLKPEEIRKLQKNQCQMSKNRLFNIFNCKNHRAIFNILKQKENELNKNPSPKKLIKKKEKIPSSTSLKKVMIKESVESIEQPKEDQLFEEYMIQTGRPLGKVIDDHNIGQNGWEYSSSAFKYYHLQPLIFSKKAKNQERKVDQISEKFCFSPDNVVNYNYYEYSIGKRPKIEEDQYEAPPLKRVKQYKKRKHGSDKKSRRK
jgi:hypothetical protein